MDIVNANFKIEKKLKDNFLIECRKRNTTGTDQIRAFMQQYIKRRKNK